MNAAKLSDLEKNARQPDVNTLALISEIRRLQDENEKLRALVGGVVPFAKQEQPKATGRIVDQGKNLPAIEPSKRTFLERLAVWEQQGRVQVTRCGKQRILPQEVYDRLLSEDSAERARVSS